MSSLPLAAAAEIVTQDAVPRAAVPSGTVTGYLLWIDDALSLAAVAILGTVIVLSLTRRRFLGLADAPDRPNSIREDTIAAVVMAYLTGYLVVAGAVRLALGESEEMVGRMISGGAAQVLGVLTILFVASACFQDGVRAFISGRAQAPGRSRWGLAIILTVLALGLCPLARDGTVLVILGFAPEYKFESHPTIDALHDPASSVVMAACLWVGASVLAPVAEELFFRGVLQTFLVSVLRHRWGAIGVASIAFGAVHIGQPHAIAALALLGALLGYAYERTGSLIPCIAIHAVFNLKTLIWDALAPAGP